MTLPIALQKNACQLASSPHAIYERGMSPSAAIERHVVLVHPEVHWNTGNAGRTCLGFGAHLHLIEPLGFSLEEKQVRRAGLDYWELVSLSVWKDVDAFCSALSPQKDEVALITKYGSQSLWEMPRSPRQFFLFGSETKGLPDSIRTAYPDNTYRIPITDEIRSLNLSTTVGIVLYEHLRMERKQLK